MTETRLKKTVDYLYDMEINNYLMEQTICALKSRIDSLGHLTPPEKQSLENENVKPEKYNGGGNALFFAFIGAILGGIITVIVCLIKYFSYVANHWDFTAVVKALPNALFKLFIYTLLGALCTALVGAIIGFFVDRTSKNRFDQKAQRDAQATNRKNKKINAQRTNDYNKRKMEYDQLLSKEMSLKRILTSEREALIKKKVCSQVNLSLFYSNSGLAQEYCHVVPIKYMSDYIRLGISTRLEGDRGLYDRIRQDVRADMFQASLNNISHQLNSMNNYERAILNELQKQTEKSDIMIANSTPLLSQASPILFNNESFIKRTIDNSEVTKYIQRRIRIEKEYGEFFGVVITNY